VPSPTVALLPAPQLLTPADGSILVFSFQPLTFTWASVSGAARYHLEFQVCVVNFTATDADHGACTIPSNLYTRDTGPGAWGNNPDFMSTGTRISVPNIGEFQPHRWRVTAVNSAGQSGLPSPWNIYYMTGTVS
jgi:hypothetical protein